MKNGLFESKDFGEGISSWVAAQANALIPELLRQLAGEGEFTAQDFILGIAARPGLCAEQANTKLQALRAKDKSVIELLRKLLKTICAEWNEVCEPNCDSYGHDSECAAVHIAVAKKRMKEEIEGLRNELKDAKAENYSDDFTDTMKRLVSTNEEVAALKADFERLRDSSPRGQSVNKLLKENAALKAEVGLLRQPVDGRIIMRNMELEAENTALREQLDRWNECHKACSELLGETINEGNRPLGLTAAFALLKMSRDRLTREREEAVTVYAWKDQDDWRVPSDETDGPFTWSARLIAIEEIK